MKLHVRKGDNVKILTGKDKGKTGRITAVNPDTGRIVVDGSNTIIKHNKAKNAQSQSSILKMAGSIDSSNVQIVCPACAKATRVAKLAADAKSKAKFVRACKKCNASLDVKQDKKVDKKAKKAKKDDEVATDAGDAKTATTKAKASTKAKKAVAGEEEVAGTSAKKDGDGVTTKNADGAIV